MTSGDQPMLCARGCGVVGVAAWKVCADARFRVLCPACDLEANELLLAFLKVRNRRHRLAQYRRSMDLRPVTRDRLREFVLCAPTRRATRSR